MNTFAGSVALWPFEQLLNRLRKQDPHIDRLLKPFAGKCIAINTRAPTLSMTVVFEEKSLRLSSLSAAELNIEADAEISGSVNDLLAQLTELGGDGSKRALAGGGVRIEGDAQLVQDLMLCLRALDLQWEDYAEQAIGGIATDRISKAVDDFKTLFVDTRQRLGSSLEDYLKDEIRLVPHHLEVAQFSEQLDALKLQLDRLQARTEHLESRLDKTHSHKQGA